RHFILSGLQRNMQALGAFSFLSMVKGKGQFRQYIPLCLDHLREGLQDLSRLSRHSNPLKRLEKICASIEFRI
ncbi:hypothetical protein ACFL6Y_11265, partial [Elusimicrobiota bacterium]